MYNNDYLFSAPLIEIFNGTSFIAMRSMVSKLVDQEELGKISFYFSCLKKIYICRYDNYMPLFTCNKYILTNKIIMYNIMIRDLIK